MLTGWKKLDKKQLKHLREYHVTHDYDAAKMFQEQANRRIVLGNTFHYEPCHDCRYIAKTLGYPIDPSIDTLREYAIMWRMADSEGFPTRLEWRQAIKS